MRDELRPPVNQVYPNHFQTCQRQARQGRHPPPQNQIANPYHAKPRVPTRLFPLMPGNIRRLDLAKNPTAPRAKSDAYQPPQPRPSQIDYPRK